MGVNRSNIDQYQLRLPPGLRERIKAAAEASGRSMNTEIVFRLEESLGEASSEPAAMGTEIRRLQAENETLRWNFEVLAKELAGPAGENREEVIRLLTALRILGRNVA
ncbi:Arc family DNA-binding protein [Rhizobium glycinendophyticum]|uniref:Arc family DNA-binding protein n=1 Tax=Rhizobium glycinendophyticum TaxID=2589807 RepID=A0A504TX02_9HYPH|nr:Arc family DNA-binding protein [Rhizobium glycinendophyticum]TPP07034.1 Arc family DNA-binding protein [Rhizobium glycinendophyticum]